MTNRRGRPKVSSVETLAEAAIELFLEVGFERASIDDIALRAGVSRGTFFTYFPGGKADALWSQLLPTDAVAPAADGEGVRAAADALIALVEPWGDSVPQVLRDAQAMGAVDVLVESAGSRLRQISERLALRIALDDDSLPESARPAVASAALVGAAVGAVVAWAKEPHGTAAEALQTALSPLVAALASP